MCVVCSRESILVTDHNGGNSTIFMGTGVNERSSTWKVAFLDVRSGQTLSDVKSPRYDSQEPQVMLGTDLARNLKVAVGDWVTLLATTSDGALNAPLILKVQGIYSTGVPELDKRQLYVHITTAQELFGLRQSQHLVGVPIWNQQDLDRSTTHSSDFRSK